MFEPHHSFRQPQTDPQLEEERLVNDLEKKSDDLTSVSDEEVVEVVVCVGVF